MKNLLAQNLITGLIVLAGIIPSISFAQIWSVQNSYSTRNLNSLFFVNDSVGWAFGKGNGGSLEGNIRMTSTAGASWSISNLNLSNAEIFGSYFFNDNYGLAVGELSSGSNDGLIIKTIDGGQTWSVDNSTFEEELFDIHFKGNTGCIVGEDGTLAISQDSGNSWQRLTISNKKSEEKDLYGIFLADTSLLIAVGEKGTILRSHDSGRSWNSLTANTEEDLLDVYFSSSSDGWIVGENGTILKSTNGGQSWARQTWIGNKELTGVHFVNDSAGWICGKYGTILKTTDGGLNWIQENSGTNQHIWDIFMISESLGWFCGYDGMIHIYQDTSNVLSTNLSPTGITGISVAVGPNPCYDGKVTIRIADAYPAQGEITLWGQDGHLWQKLDLKNKNEIRLDLTPIPSGLYFLRIHSQEGLEFFSKLLIYNNK